MNGLQILGDVRVERARGAWLHGGDVVEHLEAVAAGDGWLARQ
jgi:hypothetical protein